MSKPFIIGIAGGSGSGKTFFLNCFLKHFKTNEVCLVSQDDYYLPVADSMTPEENRLYNFDLPHTIDKDTFLRDINKLIAGESFTKKEYTFGNSRIVPKMLEIKPAPIIIVEGLFIMHFTEIANLLDMKIFIDADEEVALQRRLHRDLVERGYSSDDVMYKWINHVVPAYKDFLLPFKSDCHKIVINNTQVPDDIVAITEEISKELKTQMGYIGGKG